MNRMEIPKVEGESSSEEKYPMIRTILDEAERIGYKGDDEMRTIVVGAIQGLQEVGEIKSFLEQFTIYLAERNEVGGRVAAVQAVELLKPVINQLASTDPAHPEKARDTKIVEAWREAVPGLKA